VATRQQMQGKASRHVSFSDEGHDVQYAVGSVPNLPHCHLYRVIRSGVRKADLILGMWKTICAKIDNENHSQ